MIFMAFPHSLGATALVLATVFSAPAAGQDMTEIPNDLPEAADKFLWCSSAMRLLGFATADAEEAETYFAASELLVQEAANTLMAAGIAAGEVEGIVVLYDEKVVSEFESEDELAYAPQVCIDALGL